MTLFAAAETLTWEELPAWPDRLGVAGAFAGVSHETLLVAGGANFPGRLPWEGGSKVWHDEVWRLEQPEGPWRLAGRLPRPLGYGLSVTWREQVICVGGSDPERHYAEAFLLTWKAGVLQTRALPALPIACAGSAGALAGDVVYLAGGSETPGEQTATNRAFALDLAAAVPAWRELPPLPGAPRLLAAGAALGETFYVFGGAALAPGADGKMGRVLLREAWSYRDGEGWRRLADLPRPSVAAPAPAPVMEGRILLLAGDDGSRAGFRPLEKHPGFAPGILSYDPALDRWSEAGESPAPRATVPCVPWRGRFVIPSGELRPGVRSPQVWSLRAP